MVQSRKSKVQVIAIGASTGGTEAIASILSVLPPDLPGIVITQHIPAGFSLAFANRLNRMSRLHVKEAADGDELGAGRAFVAPGDFHMVLRKAGSRMVLQVADGPQVCFQRPSVDVLFESVAAVVGESAIGVLLTGMGVDGAKGLLAMRQRGAFTIAQDETSSIVFGMPRAAIRLGAAEHVSSLSRIPDVLLERLTLRPPL